MTKNNYNIDSNFPYFVEVSVCIDTDNYDDANSASCEFFTKKKLDEKKFKQCVNDAMLEWAMTNRDEFNESYENYSGDVVDVDDDVSDKEWKSAICKLDIGWRMVLDIPDEITSKHGFINARGLFISDEPSTFTLHAKKGGHNGKKA